MFWILVAAMIVLALFIMLFPSRRRNAVQGKDEDEAVLAVYRQQVDDLQSDIENGTLNSDQAELARLELEQALLQEMADEEESGGEIASVESVSRDSVVHGLIIVLLPVLALSFYYRVGQPHLASGAIVAKTEHAAIAGKEDLPSIEQLLVGLEKRLQQAPDDEKGWWMLTRTYMALNRFGDALGSVEHLYALTGDSVDVLLLYANILTLNNEGNFAGKVAELIQQVLVLEPENTGGLWMAGFVAEEKADYATAIAHWQKLLPLIQSDEQASQQLKQMLAQVQAAQTGESVVLESVDNSAAAPARENNSVTVAVSLAPELSGQAGPEDILFVFARADDGLPMPVAARRLRVADLPVTVVLNDTQAMMPSRVLSSFKDVQVIARISKSGKAIAQSGDFSSEVKPVQVGDPETITLIIDQIIP